MFKRQQRRIQLLSAALFALGTGAMAQSRPVPPPRTLALVGVTSVGARTEAWLVDLSTRQRATLSVGESAFGYRLKRVEPERVVLTRGGQDFPLRLGEKNVPAAPAPPPVAAAPPPAAVAPPELVDPPLETPVEPFEEPLSPSPDPVEPATMSQRDLRRAPEFYPGYPFGPDLSPEEAAAMGVYPGYYPGAQSPYYPGLYPPFLDAVQPYPGGFGPYAGAPSDYPAWAYPNAQSGNPAWSYPDPSLDPWSYRNPTLGQWDSPWMSPSSNSRYGAGNVVSRWNAQTSRRQSGYFGGGAPSNPQTMRRRQSLFR